MNDKRVVDKHVVLVVIGIILNLDGDNIFKAALVRGEAKGEPLAFSHEVANDTKREVGLGPARRTAFPLENLIQATAMHHYIDFMVGAIVVVIFALGMVIAIFDFESGVLGCSFAVVLHFKATERLHRSILIVTSTPAVALAVAHTSDKDVAPVLSSTGIGEIARNSVCCQWRQ